MTAYRTFGFEKVLLMDKERIHRPIIRPEISRNINHALDKLVEYLFRGRGTSAYITEDDEIGYPRPETIVWVDLFEGQIIFQVIADSELVNIINNFMRTNYPLIAYEVYMAP